MTEVVKLLERAYQGFVLRDVLGFLTPGAISLAVLWTMLDLDVKVKFKQIVPNSLANLFGDGSTTSTWAIILFLASAYLLGWTLQAAHFGVLSFLRLLTRIPFLARFTNPNNSTLETFVGNGDVKGIENILRHSPPATRVALELDLISAKSLTNELLQERIRDFPYIERISALIIMTGNLSIAITLLLIAMATRIAFGWTALLLFVIPLFLYCEYWRLMKARSLLAAIYAVEFKKRTETNGTPSPPSVPNNAG